MADRSTTVGAALGAGVIGAAIGAAAGVAATKIMSDPEMKTKAADALNKAKKYALDGVQQLKSKAEEWQDTAEETASSAKKLGRSAKAL